MRKIKLLFAITLVAGCSPSMRASLNGSAPRPSPYASMDSLERARQLVYAYTRAVDRYARPIGELPPTLEPVIRSGEAGPDMDVWGRHVRYRPEGLRFEIRSAGPDGNYDTADDIIALGQLGRNQPCEVRDPSRKWTGVGYEPPCGANIPILVLPFCAGVAERTWRDDEIPFSRWDSVQTMGLRLVRIARAVDGVSRDLGGLPLSLQPVPSFSRLTTQEIGDIWRNPVHYSPNGRQFELRSAGPTEHSALRMISW